MPNFIFATYNINGYTVLNKLQKQCENLSNIIDEDGIQRGISPDLKEAFIVSKDQIKNNNLESGWVHKTVTGGVDVKKYFIAESDKNIFYINKKDNPNLFPNIREYIEYFKDRITCTEVKQGRNPITEEIELFKDAEFNLTNQRVEVVATINSPLSV